jgi:ATP-binding cassette subfamily F protein 3
MKKKEEREQAERNTEKLNTPLSNETQATWQEKQKRRKSIAREVRAAKKKVEEAESLIHQRETRKIEIEAMLANPDFYKNGEEAKLISAEYKDIQIQLEQAYSNWSNMARQLEQIEKNE